MLIQLSPVRMDASIEVSRSGDALTIDGTTFDFAAIPDGGEAEIACPWIVGPVRREGGRIVATLLLPHGADAPESVRFPAPIVDPPDGPVALPSVVAE